MQDTDQITLGLDPLPRKTRKEVFLDERNQVVPRAELVALVQPHARGAHQALGGPPPCPIATTLRIHCLQLWWNLSAPAMEEERHDRPLYHRIAGLQAVPDLGAHCDLRFLLRALVEILKILWVILWVAPFDSAGNRIKPHFLTDALSARFQQHDRALHGPDCISGPPRRRVPTAIHPSQSAIRRSTLVSMRRLPNTATRALPSCEAGVEDAASA
ncbi:transposase [Pelomonas sp. P7]|uniref:Transposase n=1 Tax=Pelomonas caseinilytica TaxID=2906763 RepID=A0ABS8XD00_9BURK|nr:transposase [Pelomonas sp. P7]MCE4536443.1 transposase [Pelomonas sp. P7]